MCPTKKSFFNSIGSGVSSLRELNWETGAFEQQVRDTFVHFGNRMTTLVGPTTHPIKEYAREKPVTAAFLGFFVFVCLFPIVSFITFALVTIGIGLAGFLFIEGTLLSVALFILGSCLLTITCIAATIGGFLFSIYFVVKTIRNKVSDIISKVLPSPPVPVENGKVPEVSPDDESGVSSDNDNESLAHTD